MKFNNCAHCGEYKFIKHRGLCPTCYENNKKEIVIELEFGTVNAQMLRIISDTLNQYGEQIRINTADSQYCLFVSVEKVHAFSLTNSFDYQQATNYKPFKDSLEKVIETMIDNHES